MLARYLQSFRLRHTYRFLFIPGTIGSLTWLARNEDEVRQIVHGLVLSRLGDAGGMTYKQSRRGNALIDRIVGHVLCHDEAPPSHHASRSLASLKPAFIHHPECKRLLPEIIASIGGDPNEIL